MSAKVKRKMKKREAGVHPLFRRGRKCSNRMKPAKQRRKLLQRASSVCLHVRVWCVLVRLGGQRTIRRWCVPPSLPVPPGCSCFIVNNEWCSLEAGER